MTGLSSENARAFTPSKNENGLEEYKLSGVELKANDQLKVYSSSDSWFPGGYGGGYTVAQDGTYDIYFRPHGDGNDAWHQKYFYLANVTPYTITWLDGDGNTLKIDTVTCGDTPRYTGDVPAKAADAQYTYIFNNTWLPEIAPATANATYTAQFDTTVNPTVLFGIMTTAPSLPPKLMNSAQLPYTKARRP